MATGAAIHRLRRPATPGAAAYPTVRRADREGRGPHTSDPSEEFSYV